MTIDQQHDKTTGGARAHMKLRRISAAVGTFVAVLALTASASANTTITATAGPVTIPGVPVEVCVVQGEVPLNECVKTPGAQTLALTVVVHVPTPNVVVVPPAIESAQCPAGTEGVALKVNTGSAGATIGGTVTVTLTANEMPVTQTIPINQVVAGPNQTVTVFACAGIQPGV